MDSTPIIKGLTLVTPICGEEEITSSKNHIAPVSLTDWCIMIYVLNNNVYFVYSVSVEEGGFVLMTDVLCTVGGRPLCT